MQQAGRQDCGHHGPGPGHAVVHQHPDHPGRIQHRGAQPVREDERGTPHGRALGKQIPRGVGPRRQEDH
ncbi:hypothetical protein G6F50_018713 [Rhizopus delemar]|uniref:Uncharacterized protein n=1 Tax=Rhizopus delemar TaxID=936053 RepID=A0A9P7BYN4_9FUNG|nr:hypothetical protein G6F50_018713 [Rhizopus delemar]